mmetsp:Transcript_70942/g.169904  ORF Transcript_70942/g.169904 Transcript_70942/m.169904 type:complete len:200 (+) Transcript_70942:1506-2105(+)
MQRRICSRHGSFSWTSRVWDPTAKGSCHHVPAEPQCHFHWEWLLTGVASPGFEARLAQSQYHTDGCQGVWQRQDQSSLLGPLHHVSSGDRGKTRAYVRALRQCAWHRGKHHGPNGGDRHLASMRKGLAELSGILSWLLVWHRAFFRPIALKSFGIPENRYGAQETQSCDGQNTEGFGEGGLLLLRRDQATDGKIEELCG